MTSKTPKSKLPNAFERERFLRVLGVDATTWSRRYGLEPFVQACYACGRELRTEVPFAHGPFRGLLAVECSCGDKFPPYCVTHVGGKDVFQW